MTRLVLLPMLLASAALATETLPLASNEYSLTVTHEAKHPAVRTPGDAIPEKEYHVTRERSILHLRFTDDRKGVEILPRGIVGEVSKADSKKRVYRLTQGLVAGDRLTIESTKTGMIATFCEYGSGVPVISSVRGKLKPETPKVAEGGAGKPATRSKSDSDGAEKAQPNAEGRSR